MHEPVGRARFQKTEAFGAAPDLCGRVRTYAMRTLVDLARRFVLCGLATGCVKTYKTHWHGCAQQSASDAATLLVFGSAAGGC